MENKAKSDSKDHPSGYSKELNEKDTSIHIGFLKEFTYPPHYYRRPLYTVPGETQKQYMDRVTLEWKSTGGTFHF